MSFDAPNIMLAGLVKIELPDQTIRLCDGGFVYFDAEKYTSADEDFGAVESVDAFEENIGDDAPAGRMTFLPASAAAIATLSQPSFQGSRVRFWLVRVTEATGIVEDSELIGDMELDTTKVRLGRGSRRLDMDFISIAERLFNISEGNVLSPRFHKSIWPSETGLDNATGVPLTKAWGVVGPPRGSVARSGGGGSRTAFTAAGGHSGMHEV
jgi:hypothetical protein